MIWRISIPCLVKRKILRWDARRSRPEIASWHTGDVIGGRWTWDQGKFVGLNNDGRIVLMKYDRYWAIALWRGHNRSLSSRKEEESSQRLSNAVLESLHAPALPRRVDWTVTEESTYKPGSWVN